MPKKLKGGRQKKISHKDVASFYVRRRMEISATNLFTICLLGWIVSIIVPLLVYFTIHQITEWRTQQSNNEKTKTDASGSNMTKHDK